ncbi:coenzyme F420 hydrogenase/dehydrogenase subunit beta domain-containing protein [Paenibacillus sp. FSL R7-277]|uniref:Coenzyme F420 hydrogenase/dehydrogenase, beta subunit C-terminal domain n=1 Tax=Paenibacillus sp. FSL R7-277 TaxID=1227352 RepID=UPI0003E1D51C|nr:Coenzyme F420 hydrogenase/dehydrogenase, beta subunit C-terminal domain [Paenibacillus sp. FSL R7-277]ETT72280.1 coenzyme F420 hydrogenase/dehydrogenase subunit beta domain-containing protein [Paenibacillus sp. FSL R7-277]
MGGAFNELIDTVIKNDYCIGCGTCASLDNSPVSMELDKDGKYKPLINNELLTNDMKINVLSVCPFSGNSKNETEIAKELFSQNDDTKYDKYLGYYTENYAGYVKTGEFREVGGSGGMGNWIASQLLNHNLVDAIIHVKSNTSNENQLFDYQISYSQDDLSNGAKSKYYPIELSQVLQLVKKNEGKYALIGIPCYIKSIRLLAEQDEEIKARIKFFIGLVCGHLKSDLFAKSIGWQLGINPEDLTSIDFRKKMTGRGANDYGVEVTGEYNSEKIVLSSPSKDLYTTNWGHGLFKYNACEYCDDVMAETADVTVGDAWLPEYLNDSMGTNIVVVRNPIIKNIIDEHKNDIHIQKISSKKIYQSQASGFRHRRHGLAYRLYLKDYNSEWRPEKRVKPNNKMSLKRKRIYEMRMSLSHESFNAFRVAEGEQNFGAFINYMNPIIKEYNRMMVPSFMKRALGRIKREILCLVKK